MTIFANIRDLYYNTFEMNIKNTPLTRFFSATFVVASGVTLAVSLNSVTPARVVDQTTFTPAAKATTVHTAAPEAPAVSEDSAAVRAFQRRIDRAFGSKLQLHAAASAMESREALLSRRIRVVFNVETDAATGGLLEPLNISLSDHQDWIALQASDTDVTYSLDEKAVRAGVTTLLTEKLPAPSWATVTGETTDTYGNVRLTATGSVRAGYIVDIEKVSTDIATSIGRNAPQIIVPVIYDRGGVYRPAADGQLQKMTLLAQGRSNFANSPSGRIFNIQKALVEQLNGSLVGTGATFSFNKTLKGASGWREALGIFEGGALRPVQGGGICQAATTLYRSLVKAGLPVVDRAPHSLYVTYYKAYGVGIDATIFPGAQDLTFTNDTPGPILILARYDGTDAYVDLYGTPDGREVTLDGPYFSTTSGDDFIDGRALKANEIGWKQLITWPDGRTQDNRIVSRYRSVPSSLQKEDFSLGNAATL